MCWLTSFVKRHRLLRWCFLAINITVQKFKIFIFYKCFTFLLIILCAKRRLRVVCWTTNYITMKTISTFPRCAGLLKILTKLRIYGSSHGPQWPMYEMQRNRSGVEIIFTREWKMKNDFCENTEKEIQYESCISWNF